MKRIAFLISFALLLFNQAFSQGNQLVNAGFEEPSDGWNYWGGVQSIPPHSGTHSLKITQEVANWSGADQIIRFPKSTATVEIKGWMKTENVIKGANSWEVARIGVEFLDDNGAMVGGYLPVVGSGDGTSDWQLLENTYDVPEGASKVKVQLALGNCTGAAYFDDIELYLKNSSGSNISALATTGPADWGTWYTIPTEVQKTGSHYVDWSSLLDAPAGKHGFIKTDKSNLVFADGSPVRFWGTNLVANNCFLEKKQVDSLALRLSKMGCNLIRLHHMDAPWSKPNIFNNAESTQRLSPQSLEKLDYLISSLKKKGIYIFLDLLVHRDFKAIDGVPNTPPDLGGKQVGYFDDRIIQLQKDYAKQLLTHKNPYTGLAYKDEPAIVASEFINESSAFIHFAGDLLNEPYRQQLNEKFAAEPSNEGKKLAIFDMDYATYLSPTLRRRTGNNGDLEASFAFLSNVEKKYYSTMHDHMRAIGVKYLLSGSNFPNPVLAYQKDNTIMELITTNDYWDHPQLWKINNNWDKIETAPFDNKSILKTYPTGPINNLSKYRWKDKPMIVTEFNMCYPNEYRLEGIPYIAAYSRLQGFNGLLQFEFGPEVLGSNRRLNFSFNNMTEHLAHWVMAAPLFLRGDVEEAPSFVPDNITDKKAYSLPSYSDFIDKNSFLPLVTKVGKEAVATDTEAPTDAFKKYYNEATQTVTSETNQLMLNKSRGVFKINTPKVQGVVGTLKDSTFQFPFLNVSLRNPWASAFVISKDNVPLVEAKKIYLIVTTPVKTKGAKYTASRNALKEAGEYSMQAQFAMGSIVLNDATKKWKVYPLNMSGARGKEIPLNGNKLEFLNHQSFVFELVQAP